jgi:hypothetical protein
MKKGIFTSASANLTLFLSLILSIYWIGTHFPSGNVVNFIKSSYYCCTYMWLIYSNSIFWLVLEYMYYLISFDFIVKSEWNYYSTFFCALEMKKLSDNLLFHTDSDLEFINEPIKYSSETSTLIIGLVKVIY